mmetsp:Transcript_35182/g.71717  ORF Transcript_35182/g.71717 Transcript_35182/m.71717 type:complete len:272 (+) Transcript_35182:49-864(+)
MRTHKLLRSKFPLSFQRFKHCFRSFSNGTVTYYDTQSGVHVTYSNFVMVHGLMPEESRGKDWRFQVKGLASATLPTKMSMDEFRTTFDTRNTCPSDSVYTPVEGILESTDAASIDLLVDLPRDQWDSPLSLCSAGQSQGSKVKVCLRNALEADPSEVSLAACLVADAGVELIMVEVQNECTEDDLEELWEELVGCDIAGLPMKNRIGLRLQCEDSSDEEATERLLHAAVVELGIKHFDVSLQSDSSNVVSYQTLHRVMGSAEVECSLELAR